MSTTQIVQDPSSHIDDHDLERYHLGMVADETELAPLEKHLLGCAACAERAKDIAEYVDAIRAAACERPFAKVRYDDNDHSYMGRRVPMVSTAGLDQPRSWTREESR